MVDLVYTYEARDLMSLFATALPSLLTPILGFVSIPCVTFGVECLLAKRQKPRLAASSLARPRTAVVVPAHDEASGITEVVTALQSQLGHADRLIVVADNCNDDTASLARNAGAEVFERRDPKRRGKGYALAYAVDRLRDDPPEIFVVVDADCRLDAGTLDVLARDAAQRDCPVQADYLLHAPRGEDRPMARVSAFAVLVRNRVRPLGLTRLQLPCLLTGSGMAFPWAQINGAPNMAGNIVEDMALGLELALAGHAPRFCPDARVHSTLPESAKGSRTQRRRWETGQLATLRQYVPQLLWCAARQRRGDLLALALDLSVPPLALLSMLQVGSLATGLAAGLVLQTWTPLGVSIVGAGFLCGGVFVAFQRFGRDTVSTRDLAQAPLYVARKASVYWDFMRRGGERQWVRTERGSGQ